MYSFSWMHLPASISQNTTVSEIIILPFSFKSLRDQILSLIFFFKVGYRSIFFVWVWSPCQRDLHAKYEGSIWYSSKVMTNVIFVFKFFVWVWSPCHKEPTCQIWRLYLKQLTKGPWATMLTRAQMRYVFNKPTIFI